MKKTIKISGVVSDTKKITLLENTGEIKRTGEEKQNKYKIWITKKDGANTKAYQQFQKIRPLAGDSFDVEVDEKEASFINAQGKTINYTDRTIKFFYTQDNMPEITPQAPQAPQANESSTGGRYQIEPTINYEAKINELTLELNKNIQKIVKKIQEIEKDIEGLKMTLINEKNEKSFEFHKNTIGIVPSKISEAKKTKDCFINEQGIEIKDVPF